MNRLYGTVKKSLPPGGRCPEGADEECGESPFVCAFVRTFIARRSSPGFCSCRAKATLAPGEGIVERDPNKKDHPKRMVFFISFN